MTEYNRNELYTIMQVLAGITLITGYALAINNYNGNVPAFTLIGAALGLAIILACWIGRKHLGFIISLVAMSVVLSVFFIVGAI
ncbi:hypothetical protein [Ureibacillus sp. GCM10028918]|uniref:hypothetical protein n=1 Tax=Ureibacillus sp. GCM10028918 TaxID=3273429 RepID=UPI0036064BEF